MSDNSRTESPSTSSPPGPRGSRRAFLTGSAASLGAGLVAGPLAAPAAGADAVDTSGWPDGPGGANRAQAPDAELRSILTAVDRGRIESTVRKLVSFGTRHTLSSQDDPDRGIGAARDWIFATLQGYAAQSGGRMTVEKQSYVQEPANRIPTAANTIVASGFRVAITRASSIATATPEASSSAPGASAVLFMTSVTRES